MTVHHEYIGLRWYQVSPSTSVHRVKQLLYEETDLPVKEQRLSHNGRLVSLLFGPVQGQVTSETNLWDEARSFIHSGGPVNVGRPR